jgi:hypothetical protein
MVDAANDVHSGLMVYKRIISLASSAVPQRMLDPKVYTTHITKDNITKTPASTSSPPPASTVPATSVSSNSGTVQLSSFTDIIGNDSMPRPTPQQMRAYNLWHYKHMPLETICATLRSKENPLKESTVMYVCVIILHSKYVQYADVFNLVF